MRPTLCSCAISSVVLSLSQTGCRADLVPINPQPNVPVVGFCQRNAQQQLVVTVKNQGNSNAPTSTTTVTFSTGGSFPLATPALPAGATIDLSLAVPPICFDPDCEFKIAVDASKQVTESNEGNNVVDARCIG